MGRGDEDIKKLWPDLKHAHGDDVLKDAANTIFQPGKSSSTAKDPENTKNDRLFGRQTPSPGG